MDFTCLLKEQYVQWLSFCIVCIYIKLIQFSHYEYMCTFSSPMTLADILIQNACIVNEMNGLLHNIYWIIMFKSIWSICCDLMLKCHSGPWLLIGSLCIAVTILFMSLMFIVSLWYAAWLLMNANSLPTVM
jgi:hypothetical protein